MSFLVLVVCFAFVVHLQLWETVHAGVDTVLLSQSFQLAIWFLAWATAFLLERIGVLSVSRWADPVLLGSTLLGFGAFLFHERGLFAKSPVPDPVVARPVVAVEPAADVDTIGQYEFPSGL